MTMTSAQPGGRFGALNVDKSNRVIDFREKPQGEESWINAGYFICEPEVFNYIGDDDDVVFEKEPLKILLKMNRFLLINIMVSGCQWILLETKINLMKFIIAIKHLG